MSREPEVPPAVSAERDERRLVAAAVRLLMRLPRVARYGLLALALAGGAEMSGGVDAVLEALLAPDPVPVAPAQPPSRAKRPDLRLERADAEALRVR